VVNMMLIGGKHILGTQNALFEAGP
jgi:hypothetical protein